MSASVVNRVANFDLPDKNTRVAIKSYAARREHVARRGGCAAFDSADGKRAIDLFVTPRWGRRLSSDNGGGRSPDMLENGKKSARVMPQEEEGGGGSTMCFASRPTDPCEEASHAREGPGGSGIRRQRRPDVKDLK